MASKHNKQPGINGRFRANNQYSPSNQYYSRINSQKQDQINEFANECVSRGITSQSQIRNLGRKKGFTLIELLVVVGIIGTLTAILLPALGSARETAKRAVCGSQLHQQGIALQSYSDDNNGFLPFQRDTNNIIWNGTEQQKLFLGKLYDQYLKDLGVLYCPSQNYWKKDGAKGTNKFEVVGEDSYGSYFSRGIMQFDPSLDSQHYQDFVKLEKYEDKNGLVTDVELPQANRNAHKTGVNALNKDSSVHWLSGVVRKGSPDTWNDYWDRVDKGLK